MSDFLLPSEKAKASLVNPRTIVIFSQKKTGKTSALAELEDNLILDFDGSCGYYDAMSINIQDLDTLDNFSKALHTSGKKYKYITIDTVTGLKEKILNQLAVRAYNKDESKNEDLNFDIDKLAFGRGQVYKREALFRMMEFLTKYCNTLIIVGHVADKSVTTTGQTVKDLNLEGKLKDILAYRVDAIGYLYRNSEKPNSNILSFAHSDEVLGGSRSKHLRGKEFEISTLDENGDIVTHWDKIFI